jgi:hypothetical protein
MAWKLKQHGYVKSEPKELDERARQELRVEFRGAVEEAIKGKPVLDNPQVARAERQMLLMGSLRAEMVSPSVAAVRMSTRGVVALVWLDPKADAMWLLAFYVTHVWDTASKREPTKQAALARLGDVLGVIRLGKHGYQRDGT